MIFEDVLWLIFVVILFLLQCIEFRVQLCADLTLKQGNSNVTPGPSREYSPYDDADRGGEDDVEDGAVDGADELFDEVDDDEEEEAEDFVDETNEFADDNEAEDDDDEEQVAVVGGVSGW